MPALLADPALNQTMLLVVGVGMVIALGTVFFMQWTMTQRRQEKREEEKFQMERERFNFELRAKAHDAAVAEEMRAAMQKADESAGEAAAAIAGVDQDVHGSAGNGSGGFIIMDMPEKDRPLFHDLLKGFEDFAHLKGYMIAFSIDSTFAGRIAFKFTIKDDGIVVGAERVRRDFAEYVNQVRNKDLDDLDNLPVVTSMEEHNLLVTVLKNRITFLKHSYQLSQNAVQFYERMMTNAHAFPALPAPSIIVHNSGGAMDSRNYNAVNSQKVLQGDSNSLRIPGDGDQRSEVMSISIPN